MRKIEAISFDVGGTLIEPFPSVGHIYAETAIQCGLPSFSPELLEANFGRAWKEQHRFDYTRDAWFGLVRATFHGLCEVSEAMFSELYTVFEQARPWRIFDDVLPALQLLKARHIQLIIISNWDERLRPLLANLELGPWFHGIYASGEHGFHKPDPRFFLAAAQAIQVEPARILHVGDRHEEDYLGAVRAGFQALRLVRTGPVAEPHEIDSLLQLSRLIED